MQQRAGKRVVVTGYGMVTPLGANSEITFERASRGESGIDFLRSFPAEGLPCRIGGQVEDAWLDGYSLRGLQGLEKCSSRGLKIMVTATSEAAGMARLETVADRERIGVSLGYHAENPSVEDMLLFHSFYNGNGSWDIEGLSSKASYSFFNFFRRKPDVGTSLLSIFFGCKGTGLTAVSACAAGGQAIGEACKVIREGKCDVMIAGGCESSLNFSGFIAFVLIRALSEKYSVPQKASRPFDRKRNGFVMSEGAGAVILESLDHARARNAPIYGEILGYGASADAYRITDVHPKGDGAVIAMEEAIRQAGLTPQDIEYINAHGTSTAQNDLVETIAIKRVFGDRAKQVPVSSNKSMIGHPIGAAGAVECILTLMGMNRSVILPTINYEFPDPKCDLDYVPNEARRLPHGISLSNSFGFGGQNASLCLGKFRE
jgi:3-oxoacyl-[acyl-carrier-protein] synthase II